MSKFLTNILAAITLLFFTSCNSITNEELENYRNINAALERSNKEIESSILQTFHSLEDRVTYPETQDRATLWLSKAQSVRTRIKRAEEHIIKLKAELRDAAKPTEGSGSPPIYNEKNINVVQKVFSEKTLQLLEQALTECRSDLLAMDTTFKEIFQSIIPVGKDSTRLSFKGLPAIAAITRLSQIQSDLKVSEKMLVNFCHRKVPPPDGGYSVFQAIIYANSKVYYEGESASVFAGIGSYTSKALPNITANGKQFSRTPLGDFEFRFSVGKPGTYELPVIVNYIDPNTGVSVKLKKVIHYKVIEQCK